MSRETIKLIIVSSILVLMIGGIVCVTLLDLNLVVIKISSVKTLISQNNNITLKEAELKQKQTKYTTLLENIETSKSNYKTEKAKYESISQETIEIIKEATTEENYDIEYMWIKLGNYAKANNLTILVVEPGGTTSTVNTETTPKTADTTTSSTTSATSVTPTTGTSVVASTPENTSTTTPETTKNENNEMKIEVTGSYIDVSDFIYEVETDTELRFKLDNISIQYVEGTTIKTTFTVKNMKINKS